MAVVDKYVDSAIEAGKKGSALNEQGTKTVTAMATVAVASGDDDASIFRCFANVPANLVPINICIQNTALTSGTDWDLGLYKTNGGAVVEKDILADGIDLSSAATVATWNNKGMTSLDIALGSQDLATLSAQTAPDAAYDICLTANTIGSANGTIRVTATFAYL